MDQAAYELGKQAATLISRSVTIRIGLPKDKKKREQALKALRHSNNCPPWQMGRKVKRK